jgi:C4-type Zn-finger protein
MIEPFRHEVECPVCGFKMDAHSCISEQGETPSPDDISICVSCCNILAYTDDLSLRKISREELEEYPLDLRYLITQARFALSTMPRKDRV